MNKRLLEAMASHIRQDPRCRLCKDAPEMVQHIRAGSNIQAGKVYLEHHNQVAGIVYRNICAEYWLENTSSDD